ncbi:MAG: EAL domain-containing protein [Pseudomonadales bacterium]|nr:EAL domain-containing protein [Pseudomonadales bacterium]
MNMETKGEILIVEDTADTLHLLTKLLVGEGYRVRQAQDGDMALATIRTRLPDLILLDVAMPRMDGFEACQILKNDPRTADIPVIFCSGLHDTEFKVKAFSVGAVDFITKPYQFEEVLVRVRTHLELAQLRCNLETRVQERTNDLKISARKLQQEAIARRQIERELTLTSKAFEASLSGIMVVDGQGRIETVNTAFTRITGYSKQDAVGKDYRFLYSDKTTSDKRTQILNELKLHGQWNGEVWCQRKDGNVIPIMENVFEIHEALQDQLNYVITFVDISESKDAQTLIDFLAYKDNLTGLANRMIARRHFQKVSLAAKKENRKEAVMCLDLDRFKNINDSLGHTIGDQILKMVASRLSAVVGDTHLISREGGDEYLIITNGIRSGEEKNQLASALLNAFSQPFECDNHQLMLTTSIGSATFPDDGEDFETLLMNAENALYACKSNGGGGYFEFTQEMDTAARSRMQMENLLRTAVANNELNLVYQPKVCLKTGLIVGAEALVRWNSKELGFVSPGDFIPLAEESGLILAIDEWVVTTVAQQLRNWLDMGIHCKKLSVNLSTMQFRRGDLGELIKRVVRDSQISAHHLDLEITEGVLMENLHSAIPIIENLKAIGVSISLDDFGTGYSSLRYLQKLPIDTLKIDKSFIDEIHLKSSDASIAKAIIALANNLDLNVVAEGVEYKEQFKFLQDIGCDQIQGYYFSRPLSAEDFVSLFRLNQQNLAVSSC